MQLTAALLKIDALRFDVGSEINQVDSPGVEAAQAASTQSGHKGQTVLAKKAKK